MPFGKHHGQEIKDIPEKYLRWFLKNCGNAEPELFKAVRDHLGITQPEGTGEQAVAGMASFVVGKVLLCLSDWRDKTRAHLMTYYPDDTAAMELAELVYQRFSAPFWEVQQLAGKPANPNA